MVLIATVNFVRYNADDTTLSIAGQPFWVDPQLNPIYSTGNNYTGESAVALKCYFDLTQQTVDPAPEATITREQLGW